MQEADRGLGVSTEQADGHAKTHTMLAEILERLDADTAAKSGARGRPSQDVLGRLLSGKASGLLGLVSDAGGAFPVLAFAAAVGWKILAAVPSASSTVVDTLVPPLAIFGATAVAVSLAKRIARRRARMKALLGVFCCCAGALVLHLARMSLGLLRHNDLPSGFMLAIVCLCIYSVVRQSIGAVRELLIMIAAEKTSPA
jgi:drug/metabolite transporter (DMT)-like permease